MDKKNIGELILICLLYLVMVYMWSIPIISNNIPYGETDAAIHYMSSDVIYTDNSIDLDMPNGNPASGYETLTGVNEYPPSVYSGIAMMKFFTNERHVSSYLYILFLNTLLFFSIYLLVRKLYGVMSAILASFLVIFSIRSLFTYLWGQWTTGAGISLFPLVILSFYNYIKERNITNLILLSFVTSIITLLHPAIGIFTVFSLIIAGIFVWISEKKFPLTVKHIVIGGILILIIFIFCAPFQTSALSTRVISNIYKTDGNAVASHSFPLLPNPPSTLSRIFGWYNLPYNLVNNYPSFLFSFKDIYSSYWFIIPLLAGIGLLLWRRKTEDLFLLAPLVAFYLITHTDVIGWYLDTKVVRLFYLESVIFFPLIAVGFVGIIKQIPIKYVSIGLFITALLLIIVFLGSPFYKIVETAYPERLNDFQFETAEWVYDNLPRDAKVALIGVPSFPQRSWIQSISERYGVFDKEIIPVNVSDAEYIWLDYSWWLISNNQEAIAILDNLKPQGVQPLNGDNVILIYKIK